MSPWSRAAVWVLPILAWLGWLAYWGHDLQSERSAIRDEAYEPGQNLSACLDFALDDFTTPSPSKRAACQERVAKDQADVDRRRAEHSRRIRTDAGLLAAGVVPLVGYFVLVPRRRRAGFRAWVLVAAALFWVVSGMPHTD